MSTTPRAVTAEVETLLQRVKNGFGAAFFLLVHHSPKLLELYRNEKTWTLLRVALGCFGAALVVLPLSLWNGYWTALFGLALFVTSILLPPAQLESSTDRKAHELGAQTVVSGGEYQPAHSPAIEVQLFISPSHTWALDKNFDQVVIITMAEVVSLRVEPSWDHWVLRVRWGDRRAEFVYKGIFAERFARLAEETLRQASLAGQPGSRRSRAAGA
jgi:hypothetical protein